MLLFSSGNIICFPFDILQTLENVDLLYVNVVNFCTVEVYMFLKHVSCYKLSMFGIVCEHMCSMFSFVLLTENYVVS